MPTPALDLPVTPPLPPMLARLTRELPVDDGGYIYEPKWDGFRCLAFRDGDQVDLRSRNQRPFARYFPELVEALLRLNPERFVLDGEIVIAGASGFDFEALMARLHPAASRVERLRAETPACFIAFDLIALGDEDLSERPFVERRARLEQLLRDAPEHLVATAATDDAGVAARWLKAASGSGVDGVMAKRRDMPYRPGKRTMVKVKPDSTADCVVGGFRVYAGTPLVASLLLGLYSDDGSLRHVGVASSFGAEQGFELFQRLQPSIVPLAGHPWEQGFGLERSPIGRLGGAAARWTPDLEQDWLALDPRHVAEVAFDHWDGERFRHPTRFRRWRQDRDPGSCGFDQLETATSFDLDDFLRSS